MNLIECAIEAQDLHGQSTLEEYAASVRRIRQVAAFRSDTLQLVARRDLGPDELPAVAWDDFITDWPAGSYLALGIDENGGCVVSSPEGLEG